MAAQKVSDLMTSTPHTIEPTSTIADAARMMATDDIGAVIAVDGSKVCGMLTDRDIAVPVVARGVDPTTTPIAQVLSKDVVAIDPNATIDQAVQTMRERALRRVPVVNNGKPVGVLSLGDLAIARDGGSALADISRAPGNT